MLYTSPHLEGHNMIMVVEVEVKLDAGFDFGSSVVCDLWVGAGQHGF